MFPFQPFYLLQKQLHLTLSPGGVRERRKYTTTIGIPANPRRVLVNFSQKSDRYAIDGQTASMTVNGREYEGLPLTMVDITGLLSNSHPNQVTLWGQVIPKRVVVHINEVIKIDEDVLLRWIRERPAYSHQREETKALVRAHFTEGDVAVVQDLEVSLFCPLSNRKMKTPCRGDNCRHVQCFGAFAYLDSNERTLQPSWSCPVCGKQVLVQDIRVDLLTLDILCATDDDYSFMIFSADEGWSNIIPDDGNDIAIIEYMRPQAEGAAAAP